MQRLLLALNALLSLCFACPVARGSDSTSMLHSPLPAAKDACDRAEAREDKGDYQGCIADFDQAVSLDPAYAQAFDGRGYAKSQCGDLDGAMVDYNRALELDPNDANACNNRANAELAQEKWDAALLDYNHAIKVDPRFSHAFNGRGNWCLYRGDLDQARTDFTRALQLQPQYAHAFNGRGLAELEETDFADAISDFSQAIQIDLHYGHAYGNRGITNFVRGRLREASPDLEVADQVEKSNSEDRLLALLCLQGDPAQQAAAATSLRHDLADLNESAWDTKLARFVLGDLAAENLVQSAFGAPEPERKQDLCQADFYIAIKAELAGDAVTADKYYRQAAATDVRNFTDYIIATVKVDTEPSASPVVIMPPAVWITGTVRKQGAFFLLTTDKPVTGDTMGNVVLLGTTPTGKRVMPDVFNRIAERHLTARLYGCLVPFDKTIKDTADPIPNIEFIAWKFHMPNDPDVLPQEQRQYLHDASPY